MNNSTIFVVRYLFVSTEVNQSNKTHPLIPVKKPGLADFLTGRGERT